MMTSPIEKIISNQKKANNKENGCNKSNTRQWDAGHHKER